MTSTNEVRPGGSSGGPEPENRPRWTFVFPVGLIIVALVALVLVPVILQSRTDRLDRFRTEVLQPARDIVNTIQLSLAREMGALRGFVITGEESFLDRYEEALEQERDAHEALASLADDLPPAVAESFGDLRDRTSRWHGRATEAEILERQLVPRNFIERLASEEVRYEETLEAARRLRDRIVDEVEQDRAEVRRLERGSLMATAFLAVLALAAALGALWLGRRLRHLVVEAQTRQAELKRVIAARERLIRGVTHDLKNPLAAARGHIRILRSGLIEEADVRDENLKWSDQAIGAAVDLIDDLLELSRAEAGALRIEHEPTDLTAVVRKVVEVQHAESERAGLDLRFEHPEDLPEVRTDPQRVGEIVRNMVSNAVKFTPEGGTVTVRIRVCRNGRVPSDAPSWIIVEVVDTGPGIAPADRERIFEEFSRVDVERGDSNTDGFEGSGLGLAISRTIARLLGGEIEVDSEPGHGSTFALRLPLSPDARKGRAGTLGPAGSRDV